jgi:uncharacterized membrane protein (DUF2068 family)
MTIRIPLNGVASCVRVRKTTGAVARQAYTTGVSVSSSQMRAGQGPPGAEQQGAGQERAGHHLHLERDSGLFLIGLFKLSKAVFFLCVSLGALHFVHHDLMSTVDKIVRELHFDPESRLVDFLLDRVGQVTHHRLRMISVGTFLYAGLCTVEAYGLLRRRTWAEYVTLWLSLSFIPWEAWELYHHPDAWHCVIIGVNLALVAYLVWLLRRNRLRRMRGEA